MHFFEFKNGSLYAEELPVADLAAEYGTPLYIYSSATLTRHYKAFDSAFKTIPHLICYSAKSNSNINILKFLGNLGCGLDIVSGGELYRGLAAGINPRRIVYSGVGKQNFELKEALRAGILMFNVESEQELEILNTLALEAGSKARISLRVNPDVAPQTHPYISTGLRNNKFGLPPEQALKAYLRAAAMTGIEIAGLDCHVGSQMTSLGPFQEMFSKILTFADKLKENGIDLQYLDIGGGLGITYNDEIPPLPEDLGQLMREGLNKRGLTLILEPGRSIVGNAGILAAKVIYTKKTPTKNFIITDAGMNDLLRPSLYAAYHKIAEVMPRTEPLINTEWDIVGPICESGDFLGKDRRLGLVAPGDLLAVFSAGAYGFSMSSQYNSRPRAAEVLVNASSAKLIRRRENYEDLLALERNP